MTGIVTTPLANDITAAVLWLIIPALIILGAIAVTRGTKAERLADVDRYAPGDERIPRDCRWCESLLNSDGLTIDDCTCIIPCDEYKSWCAARRAAPRKGSQ